MTMRISGLASGMDIDQIIKDLMKVERIPLDKLEQNKQILEWQRDDYRAINTKLLQFRDLLSQFRLTTKYRVRTATSSNDAYVSATVNSGAAQSSYTITEVEQLASAATRLNSGSISGSGGKIDPTKTLSSQRNLFANSWGWEPEFGILQSQTIRTSEENQIIQLDEAAIKEAGKLNIRVNGQALQVVVDNSAQPLEHQVVVRDDGTLVFGKNVAKDSVIKIDYVIPERTVNFSFEFDEENEEATPLTMWNIGARSIAEATITINGTTFSINDQMADEEGNITLDGYGTFNVNTGTITFEPPREENVDIEVTYSQRYATFGIQTYTSKGEIHETFFITENDTLQSVMRKVNESSAGVTMFYDSFSDRVTLTRKETGNFNEDGPEINVSGEFLVNTLKFDADSEETGGENAIFTINGLKTERTSNTFEMNGVTFTLKQTFSTADSSNQPVSIVINNDTESVIANIKEFVEKYNELLTEIQGKLKEERYRNYKPLTDLEREQLTEKQQEKWEEMARSGLLRNDPILSSALSSMRMDVYSTVETHGLFRHLSNIGITTTANYLDGGKLQLNEDKLREALETDPEAVEKLFRGNETDAGKGIIQRLYETVNDTMNKIYEKAGRSTATNQQFSIGRQLISLENQIDRFEERLKQIEDRYWRQFTAMEKAIQRANEQALYLMQQFSF